MSELRTVFVGLRPEMDGDLADGLASVRAALREGCRPRLVKPDNYHLTVAFLGHPEGEAALAAFRRCAGRLPSDLGEFEIGFESIGAFGTSRHPARVIFAEPDPHPTLTLLGDAFRELADRDPVFHLTLARTRDSRDGRWAEGAIVGPRPLGRAIVRAVSLMANDGSPLYVDLATHGFAPSPG